MTDLFDHAERSENVKLNITKGRKRAVSNSSALHASKEKNSLDVLNLKLENIQQKTLRF